MKMTITAASAVLMLAGCATSYPQNHWYECQDAINSVEVYASLSQDRRAAGLGPSRYLKVKINKEYWNVVKYCKGQMPAYYIKEFDKLAVRSDKELGL